MADSRTSLLKCPNCGANLSVGSSQDRLTCAYCGASVTEERKGEDVSLAAISDVVSKLTQGSRHAAAEMAIKRLTAELGQARAERDRFEARRRQELAPFDAEIEALGQRQRGFRVLVDTVGVAMPALMWVAIGEEVPLLPVLAVLIAAWWIAKNRWRLAGAISGFMYAWAIAYVASALCLMPFFAMGTEPLPVWLIFTLLGCAVPVALVWSSWRTRRRARRRDAAREALLARRAAVEAQFAGEDREIRNRIETIENRLAENRAVADG